METLRTVDSLVEAGLTGQENLEELRQVTRRYTVAITPAMAELIIPSDNNDPIARQFVPQVEELSVSSAELSDPIGDEKYSPVKGIVHRYPDRALIKVNHTCAVYCRFCFRREVVGQGAAGSLTAQEFDAAIDYIKSKEEIWEVIVTGGDPLILSPRRIQELVSRLCSISHVKVVRFHTRVPVVAPEMISNELVEALTEHRLTTYVALHANHPRELTKLAIAACKRIVDAGAQMLSQTVLLRGVNDNPEVLGALMRAFVEMQIRPYYLHHGDQAPGTAHLRVGVEEGRTLVRALRGRLSGLCQPTYVLDIPGGYGKVPIGPNYLTHNNDFTYEVDDPWGARHHYKEG